MALPQRKVPANPGEFDLMVVTIGHNKYAMPAEMALRFFEAAAGKDIYEINNHWESGVIGSYETAKLVEQARMPTLQTIGPVQFHTMCEAQTMKEERERRKELEKACK